HENNSSYWGFQGSSDILFHMIRHGVPERTAAPYLSLAGMDTLKNALLPGSALDWSSSQEELDTLEYAEGHIPLDARFTAQYRPTDCRFIPDTSIATLEGIIRAGHEVVVDLNWGHVWLLVGYNRTQRFFEVKNSWGGSSLTNYPYDRAATEII